MGDIATIEEPTSLMAVIDRASRDPATDVDKLERLMDLYERITAKQAEQAFHEAMNGAQAELGPIAAEAANPQTKSKYASYSALDRVVRPIYAKHGFSLSFDTGEAPLEHVRVLCHVAHRTGHSRTYHVDMPADGKGAKGGDVMTKTHAAGAALSYGQRYLLKLIFNLAVYDDKDGNGATAREFSDAARDAIAAINAAETAEDLRKWKAANAEAIGKLIPAEHDEVVRLFNRRAEVIKGRTA